MIANNIYEAAETATFLHLKAKEAVDDGNPILALLYDHQSDVIRIKALEQSMKEVEAEFERYKERLESLTKES